MSEFKGTSGKWIVSPENTSNIECNGNLLAFMINGNQEANAKLIASAPELLEACIATLDGQTTKQIEAAKKLCYNAIKKALGE